MKGGYEYNPKEFGENYEAANLNDSTLSFPLLVRLNLLFACLECIPGLKKSTSWRQTTSWLQQSKVKKESLSSSLSWRRRWYKRDKHTNSGQGSVQVLLTSFLRLPLSFLSDSLSSSCLQMIQETLALEIFLKEYFLFILQPDKECKRIKREESF